MPPVACVRQPARRKLRHQGRCPPVARPLSWQDEVGARGRAAARMFQSVRSAAKRRSLLLLPRRPRLASGARRGSECHVTHCLGGAGASAGAAGSMTLSRGHRSRVAFEGLQTSAELWQPA